MKVEIEYANCGFCGSESYRILYPAPEYNPFYECRIVQCSTCGFIRTNPRPNKAFLMNLYANDFYTSKSYELSSIKSKLKVFAMRHNLLYLYSHAIPFHVNKNASICDVGCGSGEWLALMRIAFPNAELFGFEVEKNLALSVAKACHGNVQYGDFLNNGWPSNFFDYVTFWDVLEHIPDPLQVMQEVKRLLKPCGCVIILSPDIECIYARVFKRFWPALLFDQHLYHYSKNTLSQLLLSCELQPVKFAKPFICPNASWNFYIVAENMKFKGLSKTSKHLLFIILARILEYFDKIRLSNLLPQHLMICAKKQGS